MGVGVEGDVDVGVSQTFLHHLSTDAGLDQERGVVHSGFMKKCFFNKLDSALGQ